VRSEIKKAVRSLFILYLQLSKWHIIRSNFKTELHNGKAAIYSVI
jgi:hypothetical protein